MKNKCSSEIPNMPTGCAPDNRRPEKICGTCRYFNPEFPVNGKPAPVCLAIKEMKSKLLKPTVSGKGYLQVRLYKSGKLTALMVHRLVAMEFIPNSNNWKQINHKDENKFNNNANNLEWCDNQYNNTYNGKHNKIAKAVIQRSKAGNEIARYKSIREAERKTGIKNITITRCCKGVIKRRAAMYGSAI